MAAVALEIETLRDRQRELARSGRAAGAETRAIARALGSPRRLSTAGSTDESRPAATSPRRTGRAPRTDTEGDDVIDTDIRAAVIAERRALVELYSSLTEAQWDAPSLCAGWRVREVLAHTTMPFRYSLPKVLLEVVRARGSFDRMADRRARRDATDLTTTSLLATLRDNIEHPWSPPGGGPLGALSHEVIHGLDVSAALGMHGRASTARVAAVLAGMQPKHLDHFDVDLDGVELRATDVDWSHGTGEPVTGIAEDLLLLVCGRRVPAGRLAGPGAARFAA